MKALNFFFVCLIIGSLSAHSQTKFHKTHDLSDVDVGNSITQTANGYIITGSSTTSDNEDILILETDNDGKELWSKTYGGSEADVGKSIVSTLDGGYLVCGKIGTSSTNSDPYVLKVDALGDKIWDKSYSIGTQGLAR